jgi:hypothetical protein
MNKSSAHPRGRLQSSRLLALNLHIPRLFSFSSVSRDQRRNLSFAAKALSLRKRESKSLSTKIMMTAYAVLLVLGMAALPISALAQDTGTTPQFNTTVQGESAGTIEGTLITAVNFFGNVLMPIGAAAALGHGILQYKSNKPSMNSFVGAGLMASVSGATRLIEWMVMSGQAAH